MNKTRATALALSLLCASSLALAAKGDQPFVKADANADGKLDREEAKAVIPVEHFDEADTGKDGFIDHKELQAWHKSAAYKRHVEGERNFKRADKNKDGVLTRNEAKAMPNVAANFDVIDGDRDGTVDAKEVHDFMMAQRRGGGRK